MSTSLASWCKRTWKKVRGNAAKLICWNEHPRLGRSSFAKSKLFHIVLIE